MLRVVKSKGIGVLDKKESKRMCRSMTRTLLNAFAGSSTTLVWMSHLLDRDPVVKTKLNTELDKVIQGRLPVFKDLKKLNYVEAVLKETMRLYPAGWMISRQSEEEDKLLDIKIPKNSMIHICTYSLHRDPRYWEQENEFIPQRFIDNPNPAAFIPFSLGPRKCVGAGFAFSSMAFLAALFFKNFEIEFNEQKFEPVPKVALRPDPEVYCRIRKKI